MGKNEAFNNEAGNQKADIIEIIDLPTWAKEPVEDVIEDFIEETEEIIVELDKELVELENNPEDTDTLNLLFRNMHTLKGNSATMDLKVMNLLAHRSENILDKVRKNELELSSEIIDVMLECTDFFKEIIKRIINDEDPNVDISQTINSLDLISSGPQNGQIPTVRVQIEKSIEPPSPAKQVKKSIETQRTGQQISFPTWDREPVEDVIEDFIEETEEIIAELDKELLKLEGNPEDEDVLNLIFRSMHTLKGNSATLNLKVMNVLAHRAENILDKVRKKSLQISSEMTDVFLECTDIFKEIIRRIVNEEDPNVDIYKTIDNLTLIDSGKEIVESPAVQELEQPEETKIPVELQISTAVPDSQKKEAAKKVSAKKKIVTTSLRVDILKLDTVMNLIGEIVIDKIRLIQRIKKLKELAELINELIPIVEGEKEDEFEENCKIIIEDKIGEYINRVSIDSDIYKIYFCEIESIAAIVQNIKAYQIDYDYSDEESEAKNVVRELKRIARIFKAQIKNII